MKVRIALSALLLAAAGSLAVPGVASASAFCRVNWGSALKSAPSTATGQVVNVRAGRQRCFDRFVVDVRGDLTGYFAYYTDTISQPGSGDAIATRGRGALEVVAVAPAHDGNFRPTYTPRNRNEVVDVRGFRTFEQVVFAGSFEGDSTFGIGTRARLPFRVFTLRGPGNTSRLVVDVAHRW